MKNAITLAVLSLACASAFAGGHRYYQPSYGNATSTANGGAAFGGTANTTGGNISSSIGGSAAANNIGGSATGNMGNVNGNSQVLTGNQANVTGGSANVSAGSANVTGGSLTNTLTGGSMTNNLNGSVTGGNITSGVNGSSIQGQSQDASNRQGQSQNANNAQGQGQSQQASGNTTSTTVAVEGDKVTYEAQARNPVSTAYAAPLAASNGTCMGSTSLGGQGINLGLSFGTTWTDSGCDARYDAIALQQIGEQSAARARLCLKPEIREAFKASGKPCPQDEQKQAPVASADEPTDPFVRRRLGLAAL